MSATQNSVAQFSQEDLDAAVQDAEQQGKTVVIENKSPEQVVTEVQRLFPAITLLDVKASNKEIVHKLNECIEALNILAVQHATKPAGKSATRDRGPVSDRTMTEDDARKIMLGELSSATHKVAAETLGLSYGQVYSARKGFTFKHVCKEASAAGKTW